MGAASFLQSSFLGGQWSQFMQGRMDHPKYGTAMSLCLNALPVEEGACVRRPGTRELGTTRAGAPGRCIAFEFVKDAPYQMEFTDGHLRLWAGNAIATGAAVPVAGVDASTPAVVRTASPHGFPTGAQVVFRTSDPAQAVAASPYLGQFFSVTAIDSLSFSLSDPRTDVGTPGTAYAPGGSALLLSVAQVVDFATPYTQGSWASLRAVPAQSSDRASECFLLHPNLPPMLLTVTADPVPSLPFYQFALTTPEFADGPYLDPVQSTTATLAGSGPWSGNVLLTFADPVTEINAGRGFFVSDIGRTVRLLNEPPAYAPAATYTNGQVVSYPGPVATTGDAGSSYYTMNDPADTVGQSGNQPDLSPTIWQLTPQVSFWNWGVITGFPGTGLVNVRLKGPQAMTHAAVTTFALGAFSGTTGYPACGGFHQGRLWLAGVFANRFDASASNDALNMAPTTTTGVVLDSSAISETLNSADRNMIYWFSPDHLGLVCGSLSGEWLIQASSLSDPLTPTSIQAHRVTKYGCANILPVRTGIALVFVQKFRRKLLELLTDVFTGKFIAPNLSLAAKNLMAPGVAEIAYQEELTPVVWARGDDGSLFGCTYRRVSAFTTEEPAFTGWHRHSLGSGRSVVSISVGPSPDGKLDALFLVAKDSGGTHYVETMTSLFDEDAELPDAWFMDAALVPAAASLASDGTGITFYGLNGLNGQTATAWIGGLDCGEFQVSGGSAFVPFGIAGGYFSLGYLKMLSASRAGFATGVVEATERLTIPALFGFPYVTRGKLLRPVAPQATGAQNGPALGKARSIAQFAALLNNCVNGTISFGTDFAAMRPANLTSPSGKAYTPLEMASGVHWDTLEDDVGFDGMIGWEVTRPYPASVCAIEGFIRTQDR